MLRAWLNVFEERCDGDYPGHNHARLEGHPQRTSIASKGTQEIGTWMSQIQTLGTVRTGRTPRTLSFIVA